MFRKKVYTSLEEIQEDIDIRLEHYNNDRAIQASIVMVRHR